MPDSGLIAEPRRDATLRDIAREWTRIGCVGFGGPPAHIALLCEVCVERREWPSAEEFEDAVASTNLLRPVPLPENRGARSPGRRLDTNW